jgi:RHS repeat-associated protein
VETVVNGLPATLAYAFTYDNVADRRSMTLGNGVTETSDFDAVHRPTSIAWSGLAELTLGYDNVGNVSSLTDNTSSAAPTPFWLTKYDYVGNRLDNVVDSTLRHYLYDDAGNTTDDGMRTFIYDQGQRLVQVKQGSTVLVENEYDGKGRRVIKRANNGATVTVFHYDLSDRLIAETDPSGNLKVEYVYLEGRPLAQIRHTGSSEAAYYYHADHLGTPRMMTDGTGTVVWRVDTDPFGNEIGTPIKTVENNLRFPGQYFDAETGLHQNYFRDYDPRTGRYIQGDPIGLRGGLNTYLYARGNPLRYSDASGLAPVFMPEHMDTVPPPTDIWEHWSDLYNTSRRLRTWGHGRFPWEENSSMRHCVVSCLVAKKFGIPSGIVAGTANEFQGLVLHDIPDLPGRFTGKRPWAFQFQDFKDNQRGFNCAAADRCNAAEGSPEEACIKCCQR